jgi:hypothetical protein
LRSRASLWVGIIVAILVSLALYLFNALSPINAFGAVFLLSGLWVLVFGVAFATARDRLFLAGWGLVIAVLSSFAVLPVQYALGLEVIVVLVIVLLSVFMRPGSRTPPASSAQSAAPAP